MSDRVPSILNKMTQPMIMKVSNDRVRTRPDYVPDGAESGQGVFALLSDDELSPAEKARMKRGVEMREAKAAGVPTEQDDRYPIWSPKQIFNRIIEMYKKLKPVKPEKGEQQ